MRYRIVNFLVLAGILSIQVSTAQEEDSYLTGKVWFDNADYDSAIVYFNMELSEDSPREEAYFYRGISYLMINNTAKSIEDLENSPFQFRAESYFWIAKAYAREGNLPMVLENLEKNLRSRYKVKESRIFLDPDFDKLNTNSEWIKFWKENTFHSGFDQDLAEADYLIKTGDYLEALNLLSGSLKKGYRKGPIYAKRAELYLLLEDPDLALSDLNRAIESDGRNPSLYAMRGKILYTQEKYKPAMEDFEMALRYEKDNLEHLTWLAMALQKNGNYEDALEQMNKYLLYHPSDHQAWYRFGRLNMDEGKYLDAIRCFNRALGENESVAQYYQGRGEAYFHTRTWKSANRDLSMALDLDPNNPETYFLKAKVALKLGDKKHACFCFNQAYKYGKNEAFDFLNENCLEER